MERNSERSFCCGAGGARMWMEETIGERINDNRTNEAVATGADQIAVGCPFCRVMLSDGLTAAQAKGDGPRGGRGPRRRADAARLGQGRVGHPPRTRLGRCPWAAEAEATAAPRLEGAAPSETRAADARHPSRRRRGRGPSREAAASGGSLFDLGDDEPSRRRRPSRSRSPTTPSGRAEGRGPSGGSLFDLGRTTSPRRRPSRSREPEPEDAKPAEPKAAVPSGGSLFDIGRTTSRSSRQAGRACRDHRSRGTRRAQRRPRLGRLPVRHRGPEVVDAPAAEEPEPEPEAKDEAEPSRTPRGDGRRRTARALRWCRAEPGRDVHRAGSRARARDDRSPSRKSEARGEAEARELRRGPHAQDRRRHQRVGLPLRPLIAMS